MRGHLDAVEPPSTSSSSDASGTPPLPHPAMGPRRPSPQGAAAAPATDPVDVQRDPVVAAAPPAHWGAWLRHLVAGARLRLGGAALLLVAAIAAGALLLGLFGELADRVTDGETVRLDNGVYHWLRSF